MSTPSTAAVSAAEVRAVQDGVLNDIRGDGRTLLQRRPVRITAAPTHAFEEAGASYNGSRVVVSVGTGTTVMAAASPSVVEVAAATADEGDEESVPKQPQQQRGHGPLHITLDAAPAVIDTYASAVGGRSGSYRRTFLAHAALTLRHVFGAESVSVEDRQSGVAEAQLVEDGEEEGMPAAAEDTGDVDGDATAAPAAETLHRRLPTGYPSSDLYIGRGYAFRVDVDVHVQQASEGNLLQCVATAVHAALRTLRLPSVTLHEAASGVSVEVDRSKPYHRAVDWSRLPVLAVLALSPTRHYVVDPSQLEELALPQQLHVAASRDGHVCYTRYTQYPSRNGGDKDRRVLESGVGVGVTALHAARLELHPADLLAAVGDAAHVCEAMLAECDEAIEKMTA